MQRGIHDIARFPGAVGLLDVTHVKIGNLPSDRADVYLHRQNAK